MEVEVVAYDSGPPPISPHKRIYCPQLDLFGWGQTHALAEQCLRSTFVLNCKNLSVTSDNVHKWDELMKQWKVWEMVYEAERNGGMERKTIRLAI